MEEERLVTSTALEEESDVENVLRPKSMDAYVGQDKVKDSLAVFISAAKKRNDAIVKTDFISMHCATFTFLSEQTTTATPYPRIAITSGGTMF